MSMREALQSSQTLIFGHRGAMADAPMNTMAAFELALRQGADGVELDTHLSRDGQPIVLHDFTLDATTDGQGQAADYTLAQLKKLDAGSWFGADFAGQRIPSLDDVLAAFGGKFLINIEIKSRMEAEQAPLVQAVSSCIRRHKLAERVIVSSFDAQLLHGFRELCPEALIGYLHYKGDAQRQLAGAMVEAWHPWIDLIDAEYMERARANGCFVNAWTVNDERRACQLRDMGVHGLITDAPGRLRDALSRC